MAIYSLNHRPIGKSTQNAPYTAAAHIGYITRKRALSHLESARFRGRTPQEVAAHLREGEDADRKNARVADKVMLALPRELTPAQRVQLVRDFAEHVTKGRAPWLAAFHEKGKDAHNPHCHLVIRDRDVQTGKRVMRTSELGSTDKLRRQWEQYANLALQKAGRSERIDRRTLAEQGIEREPTIHEGPQSQAMDRRGVRPKSRERQVRNRPGSRERTRRVDYGKIDHGRSRPAENRLRRGGARETERDYWAQIDADRQAREFEELRAIHKPSEVRDHAEGRSEPPRKSFSQRLSEKRANGPAQNGDRKERVPRKGKVLAEDEGPRRRREQELMKRQSPAGKSRARHAQRDDAPLQRDESHVARQYLPGAVRGHHDSGEGLRGEKPAVNRERGKGSALKPERAESKRPSFLERIRQGADKRAKAERSLKRPGHERDFERDR